MGIVLLLLALIAAALAIGCSVSTAVEIATGKTGFVRKPSFWGAMIFHLATALLALWLWGLWLGY